MIKRGRRQPPSWLSLWVGAQALASHTGRELPFHKGQVLTPPYSPQLKLRWTLSFMHMDVQNLFRIIHSLKHRLSSTPLEFGKKCLDQLLITHLAVVGLLTGALRVGFCQCLSDLRGARCLLVVTNGHRALAPNSPPQIKPVLETDFVDYC